MEKRILPILLLSLFLGLTGCRPRGILHSWEMRQIMVDLHKTDAMLLLSGWRYGNEEARNVYYAQVLEKHGTTQAQFDSSLVWYTAHPQLFDKIYPKVIAQLQKEEDAFVALHAEELESPDSWRTKEELPKRAFTSEQFDSVMQSTREGYPMLWIPTPLVHDTVDKFFPQVGVLSGRVVDSL